MCSRSAFTVCLGLVCFTAPVLGFGGAATAASPRIVTAIYGLARCLGGPTAEQDNCIRVDGSSRAMTPQAIAMTCQGSVTAAEVLESGGDGLVATTDLPMVPASLKPEDFVLEFADGSSTSPICVTLRPANENNELHTALLFGKFGQEQTPPVSPVRLRVKDDAALQFAGAGGAVPAAGLDLSYAGAGLDYNSKEGLVMATAKVSAFSDENEGQVHSNHCRVVFPDTTHVVKVMWSGGVTFDGLDIEADRTDLIQLLGRDGTPLPAESVLGLADLGDNDNYLDVCLSASQEGIDRIHTLFAPCDPDSNTALTPPKGSNYHCLPHSIRVQHV